MKNILFISTTLRKGGNSDILVDEFMRGAQDAGHKVEKISVREKKLGFCIDCLSCQKTQECVIKDDANAIVEQMRLADTIVFATPVYYYTMCGQMKTLLDRSNPLYSADYAFRDIYLLATAADNDPAAMDKTIIELQGWIDCFEKAKLAGVVRGINANERGEINKNHVAMKAAYDMGRNS